MQRSGEARSSTRFPVSGRVLRGRILVGDARLAAVGVGALLLGALVYLMDRTPGHSLLIPVAGALTSGGTFGAWGNWLPSFVHPLAFGLFTAALLPTRSGWRVGGCVLWGAVNVAFEFGQHTILSAPLAAILLGGNGLAAAPWSQALARYFVAGTFDSTDLVAAVLATAVAVAVLHLASRRRETLYAS